jgi:hypothetical protein
MKGGEDRAAARADESHSDEGLPLQDVRSGRDPSVRRGGQNG